MSTLGIYIHVPFCDGKCNYCDFYSFRAKSDEFDNYTEILISQIYNWSQKLKDRTVDTIYFGGGTPSLLGTERLIRILNDIHSSFKIASDCEITLEGNPSSGHLLNFAELKKSGLNRVSLGMQSSIDDELKLLGRRHSKADVINTVESVKASGINNISLDVMLGIPNQTADSLAKTLGFCVDLDVSHISTYLLSIEPETVFGRNRDKFKFADDDTQAEFYNITSKFLNAKGFEHYEISNFCKDGKQSRHNMRYWQLKDYLGLGPSAHSLIDGQRFYYPKSIESFKLNEFIPDGEGQTAEEYIMLMLRTSIGVDLSEYQELFGNLPPKNFFDKAKLYEAHGYIKTDGNSISLTEKGFLVSNTVIADLI